MIFVWLGVEGRLAAEVVAESTIELEKYIVTDTRPLPRPEAWNYTEIPGFQVLSNTSERNTRLMLEEFRLFTEALDIVWPGLQTKGQLPTTLLFCDKGKFASFVPESAKLSSGTQGMASVFLHKDAQSAIVLDLGTDVLNVNVIDSAAMSAAGVMASGIEVNHEEQLKREYIRLLFSRLNPRLPAWFEEGLAQLLRGMQVSEKRIDFAKLEDPNEISLAQANALETAQRNAEEGVDEMLSAPMEDRGFQAALARSALMGFPELFAVKHDSALARNPIGSTWAKQCYAFVHMGLYGENNRYQKGFMQLVARLMKEPPSEALFKECMGVGYRSMGASLRGYVNSAYYKPMQWTAAKGSKGFADFPPVVLRPATQAEVGRIKAETYVLAEHRDEAQRELVTAYRRGERDPRLLAAMGTFELEGGDAVRGRKLLQTAIDQQVPQAEAYVTLARLRYQEALKVAGEQGAFSAEEATAISGLLRLAIARPPVMREAFELLADTWAHSPDKISDDDLTLLIRGCVQFPKALRLIYQTASFCADANRLKEAHALAEHGVKHGSNDAARKRFSELKASLPALPVEPAKTG